MGFAQIRRTLIGGTLALVLSATSMGCGGSEDQQASTDGLEKSTITVGSIPVADIAPLYLAEQKGLFRSEGLRVEFVVLAGGAEAVPKLAGGQLDITSTAHFSMIAAQARGVLDVRFVTEGFNSAPGTHVVMVPKDSPIKTPKDLAGKKIGVNAVRSLSDLLVRASLDPYGVTLDPEKSFAAIPFPNMQSALESGSVDAVQAVEPFVTAMQKNIGARTILDTSEGPTAEFPISGYATTAKFAEENPNTVAAFQRAMSKAQAMAADRKTLEAILPSYTKIDTATAAELKFGSYPTSLNPTRLQRVADVMRQFGYLTSKLDVRPLIVTGAA